MYSNWELYHYAFKVSTFRWRPFKEGMNYVQVILEVQIQEFDSLQ